MCLKAWADVKAVNLHGNHRLQRQDSFLVHFTEIVPDLLLFICLPKTSVFLLPFFPLMQMSQLMTEEKDKSQGPSSPGAEMSQFNPGSRTVGPQTLHRVHKAYMTCLRLTQCYLKQCLRGGHCCMQFKYNCSTHEKTEAEPGHIQNIAGRLACYQPKASTGDQRPDLSSHPSSTH